MNFTKNEKLVLKRLDIYWCVYLCACVSVCFCVVVCLCVIVCLVHVMVCLCVDVFVLGQCVSGLRFTVPLAFTCSLSVLSHVPEGLVPHGPVNCPPPSDGPF